MIRAWKHMTLKQKVIDMQVKLWDLSSSEGRQAAIEKFKTTSTFKLLKDQSDAGVLAYLENLNRVFEETEVLIY